MRGWWPWIHTGICFVICLLEFLIQPAVCGASSQGVVKWRRNQPFLSRWDDVFWRFHRPKIDAPRKFPKPFHEYATLKLRVKVRKVRPNRTQQLYNVDLGLSMWPLLTYVYLMPCTRLLSVNIFSMKQCWFSPLMLLLDLILPISRTFYKGKGTVFCDPSPFAPHNADVATRWPWYVQAEIWELNILASNRFQEMF